MNKGIATFGGGCFWCVEAVLQRVDGVEDIVSGYTGGQVKNPTYREVCTGNTGHAEVVKVIFDQDKISYHDLLNIFMTSHDPTTLNQQGADRGTQYRSVIYYHDDKQKEIAESVLEELSLVYDNAIVTELSALEEFYPAETYHQNYYNDNPMQGYCRVVIEPKVQKLKQQYADKLKKISLA